MNLNMNFKHIPENVFHLVMFLLIAFAASSSVTWVLNLITFFQCDFAEPWRDEIIHAVGVIVPGASLITVWY